MLEMFIADAHRISGQPQPVEPGQGVPGRGRILNPLPTRQAHTVIVFEAFRPVNKGGLLP